MKDFCLFQAESLKNSPAAAKSLISVYFQAVLLISEFIRELIFAWIFIFISEFFSSSFENKLSLFPSFFIIVDAPQSLLNQNWYRTCMIPNVLRV